MEVSSSVPPLNRQVLTGSSMKKTVHFHFLKPKKDAEHTLETWKIAGTHDRTTVLEKHFWASFLGLVYTCMYYADS